MRESRLSKSPQAEGKADMADHHVGIKSEQAGAGRDPLEKASPWRTPEPGLKEPGSPDAHPSGGHLRAQGLITS